MIYLILLIAFLIDAVALHQLLIADQDQGFLMYFLLHFIASLFFTHSYQALTTFYFKQSKMTLYFSIFFLVFLVPLGWVVFGFMMLSILIPAKKRGSYGMAHERRSLPFEPITRSESPHSGLGGLGGIIKYAADPLKRQMAVLALKNVANRDAIPLLKIALSDSEDDVRLLAYSHLDGLESEMNRQINDYQNQLRTCDDSERSNLHRLIAEQLWELSYLGLSEGVTRQYHLEQSLKHAEAGLAAGGEASLLVLIGRMHLALGNLDKAEQSLIRAQGQELDQLRVVPYLAEIAFKKKQFDRVPVILNQLNTKNSAIGQLRGYWHES